MNGWINECMNEWINELINEYMCVYVVQAIIITLAIDKLHWNYILLSFLDNKI